MAIGLRGTPVLAVVLSAVLAGCGTDGGGGQQSAAQPEPPLEMVTVTDPAAVQLPLTTYVQDERSLPSYSKAIDVLFDRCMKRFGFDVPPAQPRKPPKGNSGFGGLVDEQVAQTRGYGPLGGGVPDRPEPEAADQLPAAAQAVARGTGVKTHAGQEVPAGGCYGETHRKLEEGAPKLDQERLGDDLNIEAYKRTQEDSRTRKANDDWSACIKRSGFEYVNPQAANNDPAWSGEETSQREISVAVADVRCKKETNYLSITASVMIAYQKQTIEKNAVPLGEVKKALEIREKNAAAVLAGN